MVDPHARACARRSRTARCALKCRHSNGVVCRLALIEFPIEQAVQLGLVIIRQASRDAPEQSCLRARMDLLRNRIQRRERRQFDLLLDQAVDGGIDDVHRLIHDLGRLPCRTHGDFIGVGAVVGLDAKKLANGGVVPKQCRRSGSVVAKVDLRADACANPDVLDDGRGNGIKIWEVVHLLKDLQQHQ